MATRQEKATPAIVSVTSNGGAGRSTDRADRMISALAELGVTRSGVPRVKRL